MKPTSVNPGYAAFQIARAFKTSKEHDEPQTRERAKKRIAKWETVLRSILSGSVAYGSRTPVHAAPAWTTLEVVTGGFATGELLAAGPLQEHEKKLLEDLSTVIGEGQERGILNAYFLTDPGLSDLQSRLQSNRYDVQVAEEGALLVAAWLVENGYRDQAEELLNELSPYFTSLRFYPVLIDQPRGFGSAVHLQDVGTTINDLQRIKPNNRILAQKEAIEVWAPWYDRMVALFLETIEDSWPCRKYPEGWRTNRALALLSEYDELGNQLDEMARECFTWLCKRQQMKIDTWHARLLMLKNTAYAWRQMIFFLSLLPPTNTSAFLKWAHDSFELQGEVFRNRFRPALTGLMFAAEGRSIDRVAGDVGIRRFLGWSKARHSLLPDESISEAPTEYGLQ